MFRTKNLRIEAGSKILLSDFSVEITEASFLAVVGHNGSGKTSFLKAIANLLPYRGEIFLSSKPSYLSQKNTIHFDIKACELAVMGRFSSLKFLDNYTEKDFEKAYNIFQKLGIEKYYNTNILNLSGGEQQLVWLAQLLLQENDILLLDEPTQYLDVRNKKRVFDLMQKLVKNEKKLVICVTHDLLNLTEMEGLVINLSSPVPKLEKISKETIEAIRKNLEF